MKYAYIFVHCLMGYEFIIIADNDDEAGQAVYYFLGNSAMFYRIYDKYEAEENNFLIQDMQDETGYIAGELLN